MGAWNLKEFKTLCLSSGFDKAWFYTESLAFKWNAVIYYKSKLQQKINEINFNSFLKKAPAYDYEIAFELDALMLTLNSMWDILIGLIDECSCYRNSIPAEIQPILKPIKGNALYRTIKAFANVSKHRHAIQGEINMDVSEKPAKKSYVTTEFEYKKGEWHKLTSDKAFRCMEFVGKSVDQIGAKIHELLK